MSAVSQIIFLPLSFFIFTHISRENIANIDYYNYQPFFLPDSDWGSYYTLVIVLVIISQAANWLYSSIMESSSKQATLGKMALGIIVTDGAGNRISFARATGRYFAKILSGLIFYIGYIMIAATEKKQGLHDIIASTFVYKKP